MRQCTLVFLVKPKEALILLAMKKRGFGVGKWNGVGGKLHDGESIKEAAIRESGEEIGIRIKADDLNKVATIDFFFENKKEFDQQVHVFFVERWENDPAESEEMKPKWYSTSDLPYTEMWLDDIYWLPKVIKGNKIKAKFVFNENGSNIISQNVSVVDVL